MARIKDNDNKKNKNAIMLNEREAAYRRRVVQYTRMESGRLFGVDDPSSGSRVVVFAEVK